MATKRKSPANKTFLVQADEVRPVYQQVEADNPTLAHEIARQQPDCWEPFDCADSDGFTISNEVHDLATGEIAAIHGAKNCKTCGSETIESINDGSFRDGACGGCEYEGYTSRPDLLKACEAMCGLIYRDKNNDERIDFARYEEAERDCRRAILKAHGKAN